MEYFIKSENNTNEEYAATRFHGQEGPLTVSDVPFHTTLADAFLSAGEELGYKNRDVNGESQNGFMTPQATMRDGRRCSTSKAFLRPARDRSNLDIAMNARVTKILIRAKTKTAIGIEFVRDDKVQYAYASSEVILSAGAVNSPQILMLSGIGPSAELNKYNIPVIHDLPVGENFHDHVGFAGLIYATAKNNTINLASVQIKDALSYVVQRNGFLTSVGGTEGVAFIKSKYAKNDIPDIQIVLNLQARPTSGEGLEKYLGLNKDFYNNVIASRVTNGSILFLPCVVRPNSRGYVRLNSGNPFDAPLINPNYLKSDTDVKIMIEGIRFVQKLAKTEAFKSYNFILPDYDYPKCKDIKRDTDEFWECAMRQFTQSIFHPVGSCKMGAVDDPTAVVGNDLRVHGVNRLRVIDASIMPDVVNANTNAPTIMIAEKGAEDIKNEYKRKYGFVY